MSKEKVDIFSQPEVIDGVIKNRLNSFSKKGAKTNNRLNAWNEEEIELRNAVILEYIGKQGLSREETARQIASRWNISLSQARKYIKSAIVEFANNWDDEDKEQVRRIYLDRLEGIMQDALEANDRQSAIRAQEVINKLSGMYIEKTQVELQGNIPITFDFS